MDGQQAQMIQAVTSICTSLFTLLTLAALVWYTIETRRQRLATQSLLKESQKQNEHILLPIVILSITEFESSTSPERLVVRNVGTGPAFNTYTEPIEAHGARIEFQHEALIGPGEQKPVRVLIWKNGKAEDASTVRQFTGSLSQLSPHFSERVTVTCHSANQDRHGLHYFVTLEPTFRIVFSARSVLDPQLPAS